MEYYIMNDFHLNSNENSRIEYFHSRISNLNQMEVHESNTSIREFPPEIEWKLLNGSQM